MLKNNGFHLFNFFPVLQIMAKANKKLRRWPVGVSESYCRDACSRLGELDIDSVQTFFALFGFESDGIAFADFINQTADVDKNFLARGCPE